MIYENMDIWTKWATIPYLAWPGEALSHEARYDTRNAGPSTQDAVVVRQPQKGFHSQSGDEGGDWHSETSGTAAETSAT
jgi:hypothetical protein